MAAGFKPGTTAFLVESNRDVREVVIKSVSGGFFTVRFADGTGGIRVRANRLFATKEEAERSIRRESSISPWG